MSKDYWFLDFLWCFSKFLSCTNFLIRPHTVEDQSNSWTRSSVKSKEEIGRIQMMMKLLMMNLQKLSETDR